MRKTLTFTAAFILALTLMAISSGLVLAQAPGEDWYAGGPNLVLHADLPELNLTTYSSNVFNDTYTNSSDWAWVDNWPDNFHFYNLVRPSNGYGSLNFTFAVNMSATLKYIRFYARFMNPGDYRIFKVKLEESTDGGATWTSLYSSGNLTISTGWTYVSLIVDEDLDPANMYRVLFIVEASSSTTWVDFYIKDIILYFGVSHPTDEHWLYFDFDNYKIEHFFRLMHNILEVTYYGASTGTTVPAEMDMWLYLYAETLAYPVTFDSTVYNSPDGWIWHVWPSGAYNYTYLYLENIPYTAMNTLEAYSLVDSVVDGATPTSLGHGNFTMSSYTEVRDDQELVIDCMPQYGGTWDILMVGGYPKPETVKVGTLTLTENDTIDDMMSSPYGFYYDDASRILLVKFQYSSPITITLTFASDFETTWYLRFVDQAGDPLKDAYVEVWNETANELLFSGRINSEGWLNATVLAPHFDTKYNMTVKWDPDGTDSFKVFEDGLISGLELATIYNCTGPTVAIATSVSAVEFTAFDAYGNPLDYYTTTFEYNYTGNKYSVSGMPAEDILAKVPYDWDWGASKEWTVRVYWDGEYLTILDGTGDGTIVGSTIDIFTNPTYANFTLNEPITTGPVSALPNNVGWLELETDVHPLYINLLDWYGNDFYATSSGYSIVKVSIHDADDPSILLATAFADEDGDVMIDQFPNVSFVVTVYWLSHEIPVNTTTIEKLTDAYVTYPGLTLYCQVVPSELTLWDKRPSPGVLSGAKVIVTWPNLLTHETASSAMNVWGLPPGIVQLPPYVEFDDVEYSYFWEDWGGSGYLPFGDTKLDIYWSITPEDPESWVLVKSLTITVESNGTLGYVNVYVDGEIAETPDEEAMENWDEVVWYDIICDVYDAHITLVDINGNPLVSPMVILEHPTGAISLMPASPTGALTLVQVPGGEWRISAVYKNLWVKPYGNDVLNITDNIYTAVEFTFAFVDAKLHMTKWCSETEGIAGINVTLSWEGNATITGDTGTWEEDWVTSDGYGWANFTQIPAGIPVDVEAYIIHDTTGYPHFVGKGNIFVGPYEDELNLAPTNYEGVHHVYIYDFAVKLYDATGTLMPEELPYTNASIAMVTFEYGNTTHTNKLVYYSLNGSHVFIGDETYELEIYWAGVRVFNGTVTVPLITDPEVCTPETSVELRVYPVTFELYDWKHDDEMTDILLNVSWLGMNMTTMGDSHAKITNSSDIFDVIFGTMGYTPYVAYIYNVSVIVPGELPVYIPVWMIEDVWRGTPITVTMEVIPGVTVDVPEDADSFIVGCITTTGAMVNVSDTFASVPAVTDLPNTVCGILNFTGLNSTHWLDIWSYDDETLVFDWKVTAYDMTAVVEVGPGASPEGFTIDVYWYDGLDEFLGSSITDEDGVATFDVVFWGNSTTYMFRAYKEPEEAIPSFKLARDNVAEDTVTATEDNLEAELDFTLYIGLQALSATGKPLSNAFVYAVRYIQVPGTGPYDEAEAGTIAALGYTDEDGYVYLPFAAIAEEEGGYPYSYTVRIVWLGVNVYDSYEKEIDPGVKILSPTIFYTAVTDVFDVTIKLTDDVGRPLSAMRYEFEGTAPIEYTKSGSTGTDGTFTAILVPKGDYKLTAWWRDTNIKILEVDLTIDQNYAELPVKCKVYDALFTFKTVRGSPLANAYVKVKYPDGRTLEGTTNEYGELSFTQVPVGEVEVTEVTWLDTPITLVEPKVTVDKTGEYAFTASNVYILTVRVMGTRGQGLGPSTVTVFLGTREIATIETDSSGVGELELPAASYTVKANFKGRTAEGTISLTKDDSLTVTIDVFATILGRPFSTAEFFGELVLLPVVIAIVVYLVAYEYYAWRRRRLAVVPPTPT